MHNKVKVKKCKMCRTGFKLYRSTQVVCSIKCAIKLAEKTRLDKQKKDDRKRKEKLKTKSQLVAEAQTSFNRYIRARDANKLCVCCGVGLHFNSLGGGFDAGHYLPRSSYPQLRFNLLNVWGQTKHCNQFKGGNYANYRKGLVNRIGIERVDALECDTKVKKFTFEYLKRIKKIFNKRARYYEKRNEKGLRK